MANAAFFDEDYYDSLLAEIREISDDVFPCILTHCLLSCCCVSLNINTGYTS